MRTSVLVMTGKKYILQEAEHVPFHPRYFEKYARSRLEKVDTKPWRRRKRKEKQAERDLKKEKGRQVKGFKLVAAQIRTGNKLTYGIIATLKGKLLLKCDLPVDLQKRVNNILDWTLPYEPAKVGKRQLAS